MRMRACLLLIVSCMLSILTVLLLHHAANHCGNSHYAPYTKGVTQDAHNKHTEAHVKNPAVISAL